MKVLAISLALYATNEVFAQTGYPVSVCSGGQSDYVATGDKAYDCDSVAAFNTAGGFYPAPTSWTAANCADPSHTNTWKKVQAQMVSNGCCKSYVSACQLLLGVGNECSGGQTDFNPKAIGTYSLFGETCAMDQYNFEENLKTGQYPAYGTSWSSVQCGSTYSSLLSSSTKAMMSSYFSGCCKSGRTACDPAPASAAASSCFSGDDTVILESGISKVLAKVQIGDKIMSADAAGALSFSEVVFLPHAANTDAATFYAVTTAGGKTVKATKMHLLKTCSGALAYAGSLKQGDCLRTADGDDYVKAVKTEEGKGIYTVVTQNEFPVISGVVASPFAVNHGVVNAFYNIHRALYKMSPDLVKSNAVASANAVIGAAAVVAVGLVHAGSN